MKRTFAIMGIVVGALLVVALLVAFWFWLIFGGGSYFTRVPKPEIRHGEFAFRLTYELDGEIRTIEDIIVCEFDGFEVRGSAGKYRRWRIYLKSDREATVSTSGVSIPLLNTYNHDVIDELGRRVLGLYFYGGNGEYYMGDNDMDSLHARSAQEFNRIDYSYLFDEEIIYHSFFEADEAWERFGIRLISWEVAPPIQNSFR